MFSHVPRYLVEQNTESVWYLKQVAFSFMNLCSTFVFALYVKLSLSCSTNPSEGFEDVLQLLPDYLFG